MIDKRLGSKPMAGIDWENVARGETHPLRLRIIERAAADADARFSPNQLAREWGEKLGNVGYHVGRLRERGLLERAGEGRSRGAVEHFYRAGAKLLR